MTHSLPGIPLDNDDKHLEAMGVHRELNREFTSWSTISFALSILGCVASIASTFNTPLLYGGPAAAVWSWFMGSWGAHFSFPTSFRYRSLVRKKSLLTDLAL